jgi:hypothetical protein
VKGLCSAADTLGSCDVAEVRRVLIDWDYGAHGIWRVLTKQEKEAPAPSGRWTGAESQPRPEPIRAWCDRLTSQLLDDLQAWNDAWYTDGAPDVQLLQQRGRDLATRVQDQLGTDGWEVLYKMGGHVHRVSPPGNWPVMSWAQDLLGYTPRERETDTG